MYSIREILAFYSHFLVTSGQVTLLPVTWRHVTPFPVTWLPPPARYSLVGTEMYSVREFLAFNNQFRWLPVKWRHFRVTFGHLRSHDVIFCHVTAFYRELQFCRTWNVQYTRVWFSTATSRWLPVKSRLSRVTFGHLRSCDVFYCYMTASSCELKPCM